MYNEHDAALHNLFIYFCEMLYVFQAVPTLIIIRSSKTVYTASGTCQTFTAACRYSGFGLTST
jgi:hypothetical protein